MQAAKRNMQAAKREMDLSVMGVRSKSGIQILGLCVMGVRVGVAA